MSQTASVTLLSNASAGSARFFWPGGRGAFMVTANFGGGTVAFEFLAPDNVSTWFAMPDVQGNPISMTAAGMRIFDAPPGWIRVTVATATAIYASAARVPA